jgi:hypothetical protein
MKLFVICIFIMSGCGGYAPNILSDAYVNEPDVNSVGPDLRLDVDNVKPDVQVMPDVTKLDIQENPDVMPSQYCGDEIVNNDESCDGADLKNKTCKSAGFAGGTLKCDGQCNFDYGQCNKCGDGKVDITFGEECDTAAVRCDIAMKDTSYTGWASCSYNCKLNKTSCKKCLLPQGIYKMSGAVDWSTCSEILPGKIDKIWTWLIEEDLSCMAEYEPIKFVISEFMSSPCSSSDEVCERTVYDVWETENTSFTVKRHIWYDCGLACSCELEIMFLGLPTSVLSMFGLTMGASLTTIPLP